MEIKALIKDEDAVSPVIGVILMVAITVILAAVIGTFVLGLGDQVSNTSPSTSFSFNYNDGTTAVDIGSCGSGSGNELGSDGKLEITHDGGDKMQANTLDLGDGQGSTPYETCSNLAGTSDVTAGDEAEVVVDSTDTVRVLWKSQSGGDSATLGKWEGPDA